MSRIVDRRESYNKKSNIANRKRFLERVKDQAKEAVKNSIQKNKLKDLAQGKKIKVKVRDTSEPVFQQDFKTGNNQHVIPGNDRFNTGDKIEKERSGKGKGKNAGLDEDSLEDFSFMLTKDEFLDILFEDLELPDFVKKSLKDIKNYQLQREGYSVSGNPTNLDLKRTFKNALGRKIALNRPSRQDIQEKEISLQVTEEWIKNFKEAVKNFVPLPDVHQLLNDAQLDALKAQVYELEKEASDLTIALKKLNKKRKKIPYIDPLDVRYKRFEKIPKPISHAVMFCIMDVSGSMDEERKEIAKKFFLLLFLFLQRKYETVDIRFVRHTSTAQEVDEHTFFYDPLTGGTQISPALELVNDLIVNDYNLDETNIYVAQASDGENIYNDNQTCKDVLETKLLKKLQYFAYIEVKSRMDQDYMNPFRQPEDDDLWQIYNEVAEVNDHMQCRRIGSEPGQIFSVFADLFKKQQDVKI